jgi:hypothetical protein
MNPAVQYGQREICFFSQSAESNSTSFYTFDDSETATLIQFFETLDRWDRELSRLSPEHSK